MGGEGIVCQDTCPDIRMAQTWQMSALCVTLLLTQYHTGWVAIVTQKLTSR